MRSAASTSSDSVISRACYLTAACAFYEKGLLELQPPSLTPQANGQTLFIWGGSSAVGSNAIQLAKAAGYEVAVTASARNFQYCQGLGADLVFDYTKTDAISEIIAGLKEKKLAGFFDTINLDTPQYTVQVVEELLGKGKVVSVLPGTEKHSTTNVTVIGRKSQIPILYRSINKLINKSELCSLRAQRRGALPGGRFLPKGTSCREVPSEAGATRCWERPRECTIARR